MKYPDLSRGAGRGGKGGVSDLTAQNRPDSATSDLLRLERDSHFFATLDLRVEKLREQSRVHELVADQLLRPEVPGAYVLRRGKLRVTEFLPDGREVTRAVLLAGSTWTTWTGAASGEDPSGDVYSLARLVLMALGHVEIWQLPPDTLENPD